MQRALLEMAALVSLAKYLGIPDAHALNGENLKNARTLARVLEPDPGKAARLLERIKCEATELVENNWHQIIATAKAMVKQGRIEGGVLVELLTFGSVQPPARTTAGVSGYESKLSRSDPGTTRTGIYA